MRETEFRGKSLANGEWLYGSLINNVFFKNETLKPCTYIVDVDKHRIDDWNEMAEWLDEMEVDSNTVGQYTGLKDENGIKIYEGDIVKFLDTGEDGYEYKEGYEFNNMASIIWENGRFKLDNFYDDSGSVFEYMNTEPHEEFINELMNNCEVIGNIYENKELLNNHN